MKHVIAKLMVYGGCVAFCIAFWTAVALLLSGCTALRDTLPDVLPLPLPTTTTTTIPASDAGEALRGFSHATPITDRISFQRITESNIYVTGAVRSWPANGDLSGECHLFVLRDGKWVGGKFDHIRNNTTQRDFKNVHNGYQIWATLKPVRGETVAMLYINYEKSKRTNAVFTEWK